MYPKDAIELQQRTKSLDIAAFSFDFDSSFYSSAPVIVWLEALCFQVARLSVPFLCMWERLEGISSNFAQTSTWTQR